MKKFKSLEMKKAYEMGGFRERYAMDNGNKAIINENGRVLWRFTYSKYKEYQDANGATYDLTAQKWIN